MKKKTIDQQILEGMLKLEPDDRALLHAFVMGMQAGKRAQSASTNAPIKKAKPGSDPDDEKIREAAAGLPPEGQRELTAFLLGMVAIRRIAATEIKGG